MSILADIHLPAPGDDVYLYIVDLSPIGGPVYRWVPSLNKLMMPIVFDGELYEPFPIEATGFERKGVGTAPKPKVRVANQAGEISAACEQYDDLIKGVFIRRHTLGKYLDAVNFPGGVNPTADPNGHLPDDIYFITRKALDAPPIVEFELGTMSDLQGVFIPGRPMIANVCWWVVKGGYRGQYCRYAGSAMFDKNDEPTTDPDQDACAGLVSSCKLRFPNQPLPHGGFVGLGLIK